MFQSLKGFYFGKFDRISSIVISKLDLNPCGVKEWGVHLPHFLPFPPNHTTRATGRLWSCKWSPLYVQFFHHDLLTLVLRVPGQPFALGAVSGADDADRVSTLHLQIMFAQFAGQKHTCMIHGLLLSGDLLGQRENQEQQNNTIYTVNIWIQRSLPPPHPTP